MGMDASFHSNHAVDDVLMSVMMIVSTTCMKVVKVLRGDMNMNLTGRTVGDEWHDVVDGKL
jgi:hypothetical protein